MLLCNLYDALPRPRRLMVLALILVTAVGCGSGNTYPVRGKVFFKDGTPLTGGVVVFKPVDDSLKVTAQGDIQQDGTFIVATYKEGDGALPGKYQVAITPPPRKKIREKPVERPIIHPRFENYETSGLQFEVKRGKNECPIEVDKP
jgi:hypothetical protein